MHFRPTLLLASLLLGRAAAAQDNLDSLLQAQKSATTALPDYVTATFKGTRIINLQSVEKAAPGTLQFLIQHRFGAVNGGGYEFFGLDQATLRLGLEYGVNKTFVLGIGRSSFEKNYDGYTKVTLLRQAHGTRNVPVSAAYFGSIVIRGTRDNAGEKNGPGHRLSYTHQLLLARKFSERFSLELAPTFIHKNQVDFSIDPNNFFAIGAGARFKLTRRTSFNIEYIARIPPANDKAPAYANFHNSLSVGFDIETGGHVFQLHLTNSLAMLEKGFITETSESWSNGGIHLGFNISRDFVLKRSTKE
ncbi:MAG: hypothetical protein EOP50_03765 [Sphingobacteriales bacterium]|nr:MAG: hypothetical protein EOP50_03765 [Sphingobacteriales bacterium]